jgi:hypothetical protein
VRKTVKENPGATIEGIAQQVGIAHSTAGKLLGRLADAGEVTRYKGGRDGRTRLPDRFTLTGVELPAPYATYIDDGKAARCASGKSGKTTEAGSRRGKRSDRHRGSR